MKKKIVIIGSSFAGYTTAVNLAKLLSGKHEIVVIDRQPEFYFLPSFVWYPFGYRNTEDISFDTRPIYEELGITFIQENVYGFDLEDQLIYTPNHDIEYDYLVVATGARPRYESIKGLYPGENSWSISDLENAMTTRKAWKNFLKNPGPIVIGISQWAGYFFAAYEFLFNTVYQLDKKKLLDKVSINFITPEPYLSHFGIDGLGRDPAKWEQLFKDLNIKAHVNSEIHEIRNNEVILENETHLDSNFTLIIPQFIGVNAVRTTRNFADENGLLKVTDEFYHPNYPNVYAAGGAVSVPQLNETPIGLGVPRTQTPTEKMAQAVARNLTSDLKGGDRISISTQELYDYCRKDMNYLSRMISEESKNGKDTLSFIAKGTQDKWANMTMKKYIEASFSKNFMYTK
ncbi:MAG: FAD-dependent oxidoreductase [Balneolaceae bacterium]